MTSAHRASRLPPCMRLLAVRLPAMLLLTAGTACASAQELSFTQQQVDAGVEVYKATCQLCHGTSLSNGQFGTPLRGSYFRKKWGGKSVGELLQFTLESMPPDNKGGLPAEQYAAALAYILSRNDVSVGTDAMPADPALLQGTLLPWPAP